MASSTTPRKPRKLPASTTSSVPVSEALNIYALRVHAHCDNLHLQEFPPLERIEQDHAAGIPPSECAASWSSHLASAGKPPVP